MADENAASSFRPVAARTQLVAIAWLRWRLFANFVFRQGSRKRGVVGLLLILPLRLFLWTIFIAFAVGPVIGSGFIAWNAVAMHHPRNLPLLLAGVFVVWQFLSLNGLNIAASSSSFDPASLARFPLPFSRYLALRTVLGILTPSTIIGCLMLLATVIGVGLADHSRALPTLLVLAIYAWTNIFFTRMLGAWFERWFANRRFREIFGLLMTLVLVAPQLLTFRGSSLNANFVNWLVHLPRSSEGVLRWLPPGLATRAFYVRGHPTEAIVQFLGLLAWTAAFLCAFAVRLHKQFLGEYLTEGLPLTKSSVLSRSRVDTLNLASDRAPPIQKRSVSFLSPVFTACVRKEWFDLTGGGSQLLAMLTPLVLVVLLSRGVFAQHPRYFLPGAIAYALMGFLPRLYNIFGVDGPGVQIYLLTPIRLRDVILAKNLVSLVPILGEAVLAWVLVRMLAANPIPVPLQLSAALWLLFVIASNLALGTLRSVQEPRKFVPGKTVKRGTPTGRTSGLLTIALLLGSFFLYIPLELGSRYLGRPWLPALIFAVLAMGAMLSYALLLRHADQVILKHRERLAEELCRD